MSMVLALVYLHVLLMVFWIGTDVGVFIAGLRFMDSRRSIQERTAVINLGMVIDRYPRICFVAILPVGLQIAYLRGLMPQLSLRLLILGWILSAIWMAAVVSTLLLHGQPGVHRWRSLERVFRAAGFIVLTGFGLAGWLQRVTMPGWLAGKLVAYGAICLFAIMLECAFAPVASTFAAIAAEGSRPEREVELRRHMLRTYIWVLAVYAAVLICGFLGTVKP